MMGVLGRVHVNVLPFSIEHGIIVVGVLAVLFLCFFDGVGGYYFTLVGTDE
jgi:hypothetical protein